MSSTKRLREHFHEVGAYGLCTVAAFALDFGLLTAMVSWFGVHYLVASIISFALGGVFLYLLAIRFVFRYRRVTNQPLELTYFIAIGILSLGVQTAVMVIVVQNLHLHYLIAKIGAAACTFFVNFVLRRLVLFTPRWTT